MAAEGSTVLGKSIQVRGEVTGAEEITIHGKLHGTLTMPESRLTVAPGAEVAAEVKVQDAVLLGQMQGDITATGRVELRKGASLLGDVTAARLSIEDGAMLQGKVSLSGAKA